MSVQFGIHPQTFKRAIADLIGFANFSTQGEAQFNVPSILISVTNHGDRTGELAMVGLNMYTAGRIILDIEGVEGDDSAEVLVPGQGDKKSGVVDALAKLGTSISGTAKDARLHVAVANRSKITVEKDGELVGELPDTGEATRRHDWVEERLDDPGYKPFDGSLALSLSTIGRLSNINYAGPVVDLAHIPGDNKIVAFQVGESFTGIISAVDRELYAQGGPWGEGPGTPKALLPTA